jgi:hypothetical protein
MACPGSHMLLSEGMKSWAMYLILLTEFPREASSVMVFTFTDFPTPLTELPHSIPPAPVICLLGLSSSLL